MEGLGTPKLASSRVYTLSLSPCFLHARSELMSALVSSKVFRQLEFMAVGSWWIHAPKDADSDNVGNGAQKILHRVPGNREDVFAASHISMKSKRTLMRLLRHITKSSEDEASHEEEDLSMPFRDYLVSKFSVPQELHDPLLSLSLSQLSQQDTSASYAIPKIQRHLSSIGYLGPGFGAVVAKYGGAPEILQAACRASAVGGGVYALGTKMLGCKSRKTPEHSEHPFLVTLENEGDVQSKHVFSAWPDSVEDSKSLIEVARSINVVAGTFSSLFPIAVEGAPLPATAVLVFPGDTLGSPESPPVYLQVHSSDTGECPQQQSKSTLQFTTPSFPIARMMISFLNLSTLPEFAMLRTFRTDLEHPFSNFFTTFLLFKWLIPFSRCCLLQCGPSWSRGSFSSRGRS